MTDRELCIALNMIPGIGYTRYLALREMFETPDDLRNAERGDLLKVEGLGKVLAERLVEFDWDAELSSELAIAERGGVKILTLADEEYPSALRELYDPPLCIYVRGKLPENDGYSVAIVGSRRASKYGMQMAEILTEEAVVGGFTIFSGLAFGIDTVVHQSAVRLCGKTVGVLGGGLMHMYPKENIPLARKMILNGGAVISEFPLNYPVSRYNFPRRNRIVAAMCRATIVVEAGIESGALITARLAAEMGRDVFAVPGRVDNLQAQGCHKLIKEGAVLTETFGDVMLTLKTGLRPGMVDVSTGEIVGSEKLTPDCEKIYNLLKNGDADLEELQEATGMDPGELLAILMKLELKLLVEKDCDHYYHLIGARNNRRGRDFLFEDD